MSDVDEREEEQVKEDEQAHSGEMFACNICLETVKNPVVTQCGHLYCWDPCIYTWLERSPLCPVCKAGITKDNLIPIYGRGGDQSDPRSNIPQRPAGHRPEPMARAAPMFRNFHASFVFPSLFGLQFAGGENFGAGFADDPNMSAEERRQAALSRILLSSGMFVLFALLFSY